MSVQVVNKKVLNKIVSGLLKESEYVIGEFRHFVNDFKNYNDIKSWESALICMMYDLNVKTYNYRYRMEQEKIDKSLCFEQIEVSKLEFIKSLDYYIYQCSESINDDSKLLKLLKQLQTNVRDFYISNLEAYKNLPWGE